MNRTKFTSNIRQALSVMLALVCLFTFSIVSFAEETKEDKGYFTFLFDNSNGLPTSEANAVAQTSIGFIWIGGYSGLTRYDGSDFTHFDAKTGVASVNCLYVDSKDRLWIGTNDSGIAVRENAQFKFWGRSEGLSSLSIRAITEDTDGNIIAASTEGLGYINTDGTVYHIWDDRITGKYVRRLKTDKNGITYGVTIDNCIFSIENLEITSFYTPEELGFGDAVCITPDPNEKGKVYVGTSSSEIVYMDMFEGAKSEKRLSAAPNEYINDIFFASDNKMWIASNNGLGYFDTDMKYVELKNSKMTSTINSLAEDFEGNIWCASSRQGVMKVVRSPFVDITAISGLESKTVNTTCIYKTDLYIGTDDGLQLLDKDYNIKTNVLTDLLEGARIRSIKSDSKGDLWLCTYNANSDLGLICYHEDGTYENYNEKMGWCRTR